MVHERTASLKSLTHELSSTEERERRELATNLHDSVTQSLSLTMLELSMLKNAPYSAKESQIYHAGLDHLKQTFENIKSLTFELFPPVLYQFGLEAALKQLVKYQHDCNGVHYEFYDDGQPKPIAKDLQFFLFRATRELLINCMKYAKATKVIVSIARNEETIQIQVDDNGVGFDFDHYKSTATRNHSFGLFSIEERLHHFEGHLRVQSKPGQGTCVTIVGPLVEKEEIPDSFGEN